LLYTLPYNSGTVKDKRPRIDRERTTVAAMIRMNCRENHKSKELCSECTSLLDYARTRLDKCPFQEGKTTCARCPVHCFNPDMREKVRQVMRFAGPRMMYKHPLKTLFHIIDGRRKEPVSRIEKK
jgi:hypothetical protein